MKSLDRRVTLLLLTLVVAVGCASTKVTSLDSYMGPKLARPDRIIVHPFAASHADIPAGSAAKDHFAMHDAPQTPDQLATGRKLGAEVAKQLVTEIQQMGLPGVLATGQPGPRDGDIVIMGYFVSIDKGSVVKRVVIGFGSGSAELGTEVEGYQMTKQGLRRLGDAEVEARTGKAPGSGTVPLAVAVVSGNPVGLVVSGAAKAEGELTGRTTIEGDAKRTAKEIGDQLKIAFQRQGWV
jgi:hypothetical protein